MTYWIGQAFGIISTAIDISIPLYKKKWQMLIASISGNACVALNLIFLDQIGSGIFLFFVAMVQGVVNLIHTLRNTTPKKWEIPLFFALSLGLGFYGLVTAPGFVPAINGKNLLELLPIFGAVFSMCFLSTRDEQKARKFLLTCTATWAVYHAIIGSTSFFGPFCSVITCTIALIRDRKKGSK